MQDQFHAWLYTSMPSADWTNHNTIFVCLSQRMPSYACAAAVVAGLALIYAVQSPRGTTWFRTTPQGSCIILAAVGSAACLLYTALIPYMTRHMRSKLPPSAAIKRMNLLGLVSPQTRPDHHIRHAAKLQLSAVLVCDHLWTFPYSIRPGFHHELGCMVVVSCPYLAAAVPACLCVHASLTLPCSIPQPLCLHFIQPFPLSCLFRSVPDPFPAAPSPSGVNLPSLAIAAG